MANRFFNPNEQFSDGNGLPYAGGSLAFFASQTSTPLATFSDSALTIPNTNPVVLDSAGRAGNVFLQNLAYKVVLSDVNNNVIWTEDPVFTSDFSARAKLLTGSGSPNGTTAGTAGSVGIGADTYWDSTNNILYVCTTTGTASTAVWTAVNAATAAAITPQPEGYLTLTSGTPVIPSDVIAATAVLYTPYMGNIVPIYNGTSFVPNVFSELTLTLSASQASNTLYDVFLFNNSGVVTMVTGPAWSNSTAGSCARGTGAGTTQLSRLSGLLVNAVQISAKNGASTFTIPASQGTYVGSIFVDSAAGQVTCHRSYGQSRKWGVWNAYNRVPIYLKAGDSTSSWSTAGTLGPANASTANSLTVFTGLAEEIFDLRFIENVTIITNNNTAFVNNAIGFNSTTVASGVTGKIQNTATAPATLNQTIAGTLVAQYTAAPALGINTVTALEATSSSGSGHTAAGTEAGMVLSAFWKG